MNDPVDGVSLFAPKRRVAWWGIALLVIAGAVGIATLLRADEGHGEKVRTAVATARGVTSRVQAQGKVKARQQVEVASEIAGRVNDVRVQVGDVVKKGDALFALDDEQLRNAVAQLGTALVGAQTVHKRAALSLAEATRALERDQKLLDRAVLADDAVRASQGRVDLARIDTEQAQASVDRAELELSRARDALKRARVFAPAAGTVVAVGVEVGQVVSAAQGLLGDSASSSPLGFSSSTPQAPVIIADLSSLVVKLDVDELDIGQVRAGQHTIVTAQGLRDVSFDGVVERVGLMGRDQGGAVLFVVEVAVTGVHDDDDPADARAATADTANPDVEGAPGRASAKHVLPGPQDLLRPGMSAQAAIEVQHIADVVTVPVAAILEGDAGVGDADKPDRVFSVEGEGRALVVREIAVKLGPTDADVVAVLVGLKAGDRVVEGPFRVLRGLADGDAVVLEAPDESEGDAPEGAAANGVSKRAAKAAARSDRK